MEPKEIKEISGCTPQSLPEDIICGGEPVVFRGLVNEWPVVQAAQKSFDEVANYLLRFYGGEPVVTYYGDPGIEGRVFYADDFRGFNYRVAKVGLSEVFQKIRSYSSSDNPPTYYVGSTRLDRWFPEFLQHNNLELGADNPLASIWLGNQSVISAHFDFPSNVACNVAGKRRFTLFPPEQVSNLYVGPLDMTPAGRAISLVDIKSPDLKKFPKFAKAIEQARVVELNSGDALYVPSMWWHHVEGLQQFNVLVNFWWRNTPAFLGNPEDVLQHALVGLRNLPQDQKQAWKAVFEYYVFNEDSTAFDHIPNGAKGVLGEMNAEKAKHIKTQIAAKLSR